MYSIIIILIMDKKIKQILGKFKSKQSVNSDTFINLQISSDGKILPQDEINKVLDLGEQFNIERQSTTYYRILGKINPLISNVLFNTTGTNNCWQIFNTPLFTVNDLDKDEPFLTFGESIKKNLKEIDGWYGYFSPILTGATLCNFYDMEPTRERFSFISDTTNISNTQIKNWELTITYPYSSDTEHFIVKNGLIIIDAIPVIVGGKKMTALNVPVFHNLLNGGTVRISGTTMDGEYDIKRVGLDDGSLKDNYFCIDVDPTKIIISSNSRMIKVYNGINSEYYFRKFKKIKTRSSSIIEIDDYEIYKLAFSENIYSDDVFQFMFNEDIDINGLLDNLGRPLSELYLTIIKTNSNNIFSNISSGIEVNYIPELNNIFSRPYLKNIPVIQKIHNSSGVNIPDSSVPLENNINIGDTDFYGDIVEYNKTTVEEIILSDVYHRFNTINRETTTNNIVSGPRPEGYFYKAHQLIKIRDFSSYIEEGSNLTAGKPDYSVNLGDGRYLWRDLLDIGRVDIKKNTVDYPFVNGCHYIYQNYSFDVRRQDPFDDWDLYHASFPADPIGNPMDNSFNINSSNNVC
jgi:hypothetical protein